MRILLVAALMLGACSVSGDDAGEVDATLAVDAAIDAGCGTPERNAECVGDCSPFVPSHHCPGASIDQCIAECSACAAGTAWCL